MFTPLGFGMSLYQLLWYFLIYSFLGWCIEVIFCSANTGKFVNRGFLNGPVCPIYGCGGLIVITVLTPIQHRLLLLFIGSVVLTSALELFTGWILKVLFHTRWWDYSKQPFNVGGYICLKFSLLWGLACIIVMRVVHPLIQGLVDFIPQTLGLIALGVLSTLFVCDLITTIVTLAKLEKDLGEITRLAELLHDGSETIAKNLGNASIKAYSKIESMDIPATKEEWDDMVAARREKKETAEIEAKERHIQQEEARRQALLARYQRTRNRLLRAFPDMKNQRYTDALEEMKQQYDDWAAQRKAEKAARKDARRQDKENR